MFTVIKNSYVVEDKIFLNVIFKNINLTNESIINMDIKHSELTTAYNNKILKKYINEDIDIKKISND